LHIDVMLLIVLAVLAVWTEVDKLTRVPKPQAAHRRTDGARGDKTPNGIIGPLRAHSKRPKQLGELFGLSRHVPKPL
jgi:hypothetical protein